MTVETEVVSIIVSLLSDSSRGGVDSGNNNNNMKNLKNYRNEEGAACKCVQIDNR